MGKGQKGKGRGGRKERGDCVMTVGEMDVSAKF